MCQFWTEALAASHIFSWSSWTPALNLSSRKRRVLSGPACNIGAGVKHSWTLVSRARPYPQPACKLRIVFVSHWDLGVIYCRGKSWWIQQWATQPVTELVSKNLTSGCLTPEPLLENTVFFLLPVSVKMKSGCRLFKQFLFISSALKCILSNLKCAQLRAILKKKNVDINKLLSLHSTSKTKKQCWIIPFLLY